MVFNHFWSPNCYSEGKYIYEPGISRLQTVKVCERYNISFKLNNIELVISFRYEVFLIFLLSSRERPTFPPIFKKHLNHSPKSPELRPSFVICLSYFNLNSCKQLFPFWVYVELMTPIGKWHYLLDTCKLNVQKTFRRRSGYLLNVLCAFNLRSMSRGRNFSFREQMRAALVKGKGMQMQIRNSIEKNIIVSFSLTKSYKNHLTYMWSIFFYI